MAKAGHNSAGHELKKYVERIERVEATIAEYKADKSEIFAEAKGNGFDVPTIRKVLRLRKLEAAERDEQRLLLDQYSEFLDLV